MQTARVLTVATLWFGLLAGSMVAPAAGQAPASSLSGTWRLVGMEQSGKKLPLDTVLALEVTLTMNGSAYQTSTAGVVKERGEYQTDQTKSPARLDLKPAEGPFRGKTVEAIYQFEGNSLLVCYTLSGSGRPAKFATAPGTELLIATYQRVR